MRVRLKYPDLETLVDRFAPNVTRGGIFLASRDPRPVGSLIRFEVSLLSGTVALSGEGKVTWVKPFDPATPTRPHGMGVSFTLIDPDSREMFRQLIDRRERANRRQPTPAGVATQARAAADPAFVAELDGTDDSVVRRAIDRARALAARVDDVEALAAKEPAEALPGLAEALSELPRYLQTRRTTGTNRIEVKTERDPSEDPPTA